MRCGLLGGLGFSGKQFEDTEESLLLNPLLRIVGMFDTFWVKLRDESKLASILRRLPGHEAMDE